jgi:hypothetical protein
LVRAGIQWVVVPVIALLARLDEPISARRQCAARRALVYVLGVAVITRFETDVYDAITASGGDAGGQARIRL